MIVDCIADLHGSRPQLCGGELLIIAGDLCATDFEKELEDFRRWDALSLYDQVVIVPGNHDTVLESLSGEAQGLFPRNVSYLVDSEAKFGRCKIWGSPWTKQFEGMNPRCMAFTLPAEKDLEEKWGLIPSDTDILVTHSPPFLYGDLSAKGKHCGSITLRDRARMLRSLRLWVFGHIHEGHGCYIADDDLGLPFDRKILSRHTPLIMVNASIMNERYKPVHKPTLLRF